ncbi:MAG: hypothetical protein ABI360_05525 [Allobranchiibius sp.]
MQVDNGATFAAGIPNFGALGPKILVRPCAAFALLGLSALDPVLGAEDGVVVVLVVDDVGAEEAALVTELLALEDLALEDVAPAELPLHPERISGTTINDAVAETRVNREKPGIDSSFEGWESARVQARSVVHGTGRLLALPTLFFAALLRGREIDGVVLGFELRALVTGGICPQRFVGDLVVGLVHDAGRDSLHESRLDGLSGFGLQEGLREAGAGLRLRRLPGDLR